MEWFLIKQNEHYGPFSEEALHEMFSRGEVREDSLIWSEGLKFPQTYFDSFLLKKETVKKETVEQKIEDKTPILQNFEDIDAA